MSPSAITSTPHLAATDRYVKPDRTSACVEGAGNQFAGAILQQTVQPDDFSLVLTLLPAGARPATPAAGHVLLSCRPDFARISRIDAAVSTRRTPRLFAQYLRAHLGRARLGETRIIGDDRQAGIGIVTTGGDFEILLSILGSRSNIYLLSHAGKVLYSMRPLEETRRELALGDSWTNPGSSLRTAGTDRWSGYIGRPLSRSHRTDIPAAGTGTGMRGTIPQSPARFSPESPSFWNAKLRNFMRTSARQPMRPATSDSGSYSRELCRH